MQTTRWIQHCSFCLLNSDFQTLSTTNESLKACHNCSRMDRSRNGGGVTWFLGHLERNRGEEFSSLSIFMELPYSRRFNNQQTTTSRYTPHPSPPAYQTHNTPTIRPSN